MTSFYKNGKENRLVPVHYGVDLGPRCRDGLTEVRQKTWVSLSGSERTDLVVPGSWVPVTPGRVVLVPQKLCKPLQDTSDPSPICVSD